MTDDGNDKPRLEIDFKHLLCSRHGEPFRARWPDGYPSLFVVLFQMVTNRDLCGTHVTEEIPAKLAEKPACCRVTDLEMLEVYQEVDKISKFARSGNCQGCGQWRRGTPYRTSTREYRHMCFRCVCFKMVPEPQK